MIIEAIGVSDVGRTRTNNEDYILMDPELNLYIVCDGMGGHAAGEVASRMAAESVRDHVLKNTRLLTRFNGSQKARNKVEKLLRSAIQSASNEVFQFASRNQEMGGMGTTCLVLLLVGDSGFMGHVGDSRMYLARDHRIYQFSQDHTVFTESVSSGRVSYEEAGLNEYAHLLTRSVGPQPSVNVDTLVFEVAEGDTMLLCSDGLTSYLQEVDEIHALLSEKEHTLLPEKLVAMANKRGGEDNISVVVVRGIPEKSDQGFGSVRSAELTRNLHTLQHITLFKDLTDQESLRLFSKFNPVSFEEREVVIRQGDDTDSMFVLVEGEVDVIAEGQLVAQLAGGSHFGEMGLLNRHPRSATVVATTNTKMLKLVREDFNELLLEDSVLAAKLL